MMPLADHTMQPYCRQKTYPNMEKKLKIEKTIIGHKMSQTVAECGVSEDGCTNSDV